MENHQAGKLYRGKMRAWETACRPHPGQTDAWLRLGSGVGLSGRTGCSFNLSLTRCIKNNGQQKRHPATSSSQSDSDAPTSYPSRVFALKNPALRTTQRVLTSLALFPNLPWLAPLSLTSFNLPWLSPEPPLVGSTFSTHPPPHPVIPNFPWLAPRFPLIPR